MLETIITLLIYLCILALAVYLIIWVLGEIGLKLPDQVIKILWVRGRCQAAAAGG